ncbi:Uncharacterised protein [Mycobacteroides abscessus subsp. abscessus]|nr:Uncharacterised protein [Mycobacteroides abscessus subsp. abscessus]
MWFCVGVPRSGMPVPVAKLPPYPYEVWRQMIPFTSRVEAFFCKKASTLLPSAMPSGEL